MAHHSEKQYTTWLGELTGIPAIEARIDADPPMEVLVALLRLDQEKLQEVFRAPTRHVHTRELLAQQLPPHLHIDSMTFDTRLRVLDALENVSFLRTCLRELPPVRKIQEEIQRSPLTRERLSKEPIVTSLMYEACRQRQQLVFRLDDLSILQMERLMPSKD